MAVSYTDHIIDRHSGSRTLISKGIPCVTWGEDALHHYGVRTGVFDLFCLVEDPKVAAAALQQSGFSLLPENIRYWYMEELV